MPNQLSKLMALAKKEGKDKELKEALARAEKKVKPLNKTLEKFQQALKLRRQISRKRMVLFEELDNVIKTSASYPDFTSDFLKGWLSKRQNQNWKKQLSWCNRNERRLMKIFANANRKTQSALKECAATLFRLEKDPQFEILIERGFAHNHAKIRGYSVRAIDITNEFYENYDIISERLDLESKFLKTLDYEVFVEYSLLLAEEVKKERELLEHLHDFQKDAPVRGKPSPLDYVAALILPPVTMQMLQSMYFTLGEALLVTMILGVLYYSFRGLASEGTETLKDTLKTVRILERTKKQLTSGHK